MDSPVTNVAVRRRKVHSGSHRSLGSQSLSSLSKLNPVERGSGWNKLNLVKVLVLCVEMIMLVKPPYFINLTLDDDDDQVGGSVCLSPVVLVSVFWDWALPMPHCWAPVKYWVILLCVW